MDKLLEDELRSTLPVLKGLFLVGLPILVASTYAACSFMLEAVCQLRAGGGNKWRPLCKFATGALVLGFYAWLLLEETYLGILGLAIPTSLAPAVQPVLRSVGAWYNTNIRMLIMSIIPSYLRTLITGVLSMVTIWPLVSKICE
jgi:hypothetical protein